MGALPSMLTPVMLPPGRLRLETKPRLTEPPPVPNTIGIVVVAAFAALATPDGTITATWRRTRSSASDARRSDRLSAQPYTSATFLALAVAGLPQASVKGGEPVAPRFER